MERQVAKVSNKVTNSQLNRAYLIAAHVVSKHGERYLPIFERLKRERDNRKKENNLLTAAQMLSKSIDIDK